MVEMKPDDRLSQRELTELFGDPMPAEAVSIIFNAAPETTIDEVRQKLREFAAKHKHHADKMKPVAWTSQRSLDFITEIKTRSSVMHGMESGGASIPLVPLPVAEQAIREAAGEWLPIDSAPDDEGDYQVFCSDTQEQMVAYRRPNDCFWYYGIGRDGVRLACTPTHWRPLPPPPALPDTTGDAP